MIFTSGTQALQGRTVNHDFAPYRVTRNGGPEHREYVTSVTQDTRIHDPRPEFDVLDNPILAKYRAADERTQWHMRQGSWISWPAPPWPDGAPEHAKRVFARLAQWKDEN